MKARRRASTTARTRRSRPRTRRSRSETVDRAFLALLIGAMNANEHVSAAEGARAQHIIWSMRRFRRKSGETVDRLLDGARTRIEEAGAWPVIRAAAREIPARLRPAAFAVAADLVLADGKLERVERTFLQRLGQELRLDRDTTGRILAVMLIKNGT
jgi:uncharacterized tellurite resistance protein B-like protein